MIRPFECEVIENDLVARDTFQLVVKSPEVFFSKFQPGQFAHIEIPCAEQLVLRRPFSVFSADPDAGQVGFVYGIRGTGTLDLARVRPGEQLNILMPLGRGFRIDHGHRHVWLVGGGLGSAALGSIAERYRGLDLEGFFGFRTAEDVFLNDARPKGLDVLEICTEDGSAGHNGMVTEIVGQRLQTETPDAILACGPSAFYRELWRIVGDEIPVQISVEERMGCGIGGCETCVCSVRGAYRKTCSDGPVFDLREVDEFVG